MKLSDVEEEAAEKFRKKHKKKCCSTKFKYIIERCSGIGWGIDIKCSVCKKVKDITDVGCW